MPPRGVKKGTKRARQYEHIKQSQQNSGRKPALATEIAVRTVNKERARADESQTTSDASVRDISSSQRVGLRSRSGAGGRTKAQLYAEARKRNIRGRSAMTKADLERALDR